MIKWARILYGTYGLCKRCRIKSVSKIYYKNSRRYFIIKFNNLNKRNVRYSRFKMEVKIGRRLLSTEAVHHKDGNTLNDKYSNLEVMTTSNHRKYHMMLAS